MKTLTVRIFAMAIVAAPLFGCAKDPATTAAQAAAPIAPASVTVDPDGTVHIPAMTVPFSAFASPEAREAFVAFSQYKKTEMEWAAHGLDYGKNADLDKLRHWQDTYRVPYLDKAIAAYPVKIESRTIAGVYTDIVTPRDGVSAKNKNRVLIQLHGGALSVGARILGKLESVPIAGLGKIKVVAVDYRQGYEYKFPAASEDVAAVYRELLKHYKPENIGIFGCSAGGLLTAESVAWFQKEKLPRPGAIAMMCAGATGWDTGDSSFVSPQLDGGGATPADTPKRSMDNVQYLSAVDIKDPLVAPGWHNDVLAKFPPTLLITGTRDLAMSSVVNTHARLVDQGVDADLHVWEGMNHFFFADVSLPESQQVYRVVVNFFDRHLGKR